MLCGGAAFIGCFQFRHICLKKFFEVQRTSNAKHRIKRNGLQSILLSEVLQRQPDGVGRLIVAHKDAEAAGSDVLSFLNLNADDLVTLL